MKKLTYVLFASLILTTAVGCGASDETELATTGVPISRPVLIKGFEGINGPSGAATAVQIPSAAEEKLLSEAVARFAASNKMQVQTFKATDGRLIDKIVISGHPPETFRMSEAPVPTSASGVIASVPAFDWSYGCSATSAAMMAGYYDRSGYPNMYAGPTNAGVMPLNNSSWGAGECPLSSTHMGKDGRAIRGSFDDYWIAIDNAGPDPYITGAWAQHTYGECTGDYMGTNQSVLSNVDGATTFYNYTNGARLDNYTGGEPASRDGCHGMRDFFESRGYTVLENYSQYIYGHLGNTIGFTLDQFKAEIDAGRPVLIQVTNHTMLGYGYDAGTSTIYIHDTWDYSNHTMTWGGSYSGLTHYGVTVIKLGPICACSTVGACCDGCNYITGACNRDSSGCTIGDYCSSGVCMLGVAADCSALNDTCAVGQCNSTGNTTFECISELTTLNGSQCNDLSACTENDSCLNGVCAGTAYQCADTLSCTDDTCEAEAPTAFVSGGGAFEDISTSGTNTASAGDDVATGPFPVGFTFPFGPTPSVTQFWVNTNGLVLFDGASTAYSNFSIPSENAPNNFIAPYWDDLSCNPTDNCTVKYKTVGTGASAHLIIQWTNMTVLGNSAKITFQAVLFTDGSIEFRYGTADAGADGAFATVGVEYADGTSGIEHSLNTAFITSGVRLLLSPVPTCKHILQADKCAIDGSCQTRGDINPANVCLKCDPDLVVETWSFNDGAACDLDSSGCTQDSCVSGSCNAGGAPDCSAETDQCNTGKCNSTGNLTYECVKNPTPKQGLLCDADSTGCTVDDKCNAGSCVAGSEADCSAMNDQCNTGVCYSLTNNTYACSTDSDPHEGAACDSDGSGCTIDDTCAGGFCLAGAEADCSVLDDQCNTGVCYSLTINTYACSTDPTLKEGAACDLDGSGCTIDDTCAGGFCLAGAEADCSAWDDQCNTGVCYSLTINTFACSTDSAPHEGAACDSDGNGCTIDDTCSGGFCLAGTEADCSAWDDQCNTGVCYSLTDNTYACSTDSTPHDGAACDMDGSGCTVNDTCSGGFCLAGAEPDCSAMDDPCNTGICSSTGNNTHECLKDPGPNEGLMCDADSNGCTVDDECRAGECIPGAAPDCSAEDDQCNTGACQSVNYGTYLCYKNAAPLHLKPCNADFDGCTADDMCNTGTCVAGNAVNCSAMDDQCNTGFCNSTGDNAHECLGNPAPHEGALCNSDGYGCTVDDACVMGSCVAGSAPDCSAEDDQCNTGACSSTGDNAFVCFKDVAPKHLMPCNGDDDGCTVDDMCLSGTCVIGDSADCSAQDDQCNTGICIPIDEYVYECVKEPAPHEGAPCNSDGYGCTVDDACVLGSCVAGDVPDCSAEDDQCNVGYCSSISDNTFECLKNSEPKLGQLCNSDGSGCTVNDACVLGECIAGDSPDCAMEDDQCNTGICNSTGADTYDCLKNPAPMEGALCNSDGYGCTVDDACVLGACLAGSAPDCSAEDDQCNTGICDSTGADSYECLKNPAPREGLLCNSDDDGCTFEDACVLGSCVTGAPFDCSADDDQCNVGVCNSVGASEFICVKNPEPLEGELCNDADLCSVNSTCTSGQCEGTAKVCSDDFACTQNYCDQDTGDCTSTATDSSCDDSNLCTIDVCSRTDGCQNTATPDWSSCSNDDDYACFTGTCETLAVNDTCPKATALTEGEPLHIAAVGYHAYLTIPEACLGREVSGPDGFYSFVPEIGSTYKVSVTTDAGTTVTAARWSDCGESAECLYASDIDGEKLIEWTPDAPDGTVFLQVVVTGCEGECTTPGYTVTVTEDSRPGDEASDLDGADEAFADEAADISEGVTTDTTSDVIEITDDVVIGTDLAVTDVARPDVRHDSAGDSTIGHDAFADSSNTDDGTQPTPGSSGCSASPTGFASQALVICLLCFGTFFMLRLRRRNARQQN